jgi:hypothetical protein
MSQTTSRPTVFVGTSTPALSIAKELKRGLSTVANVVVWDTAFDAGTWLLGGILNRAQQSDFGVFVIREDDTTRIKNTVYRTVRDNVLFEAGVFMGALGPERTILLWPSARESKKLRLPTDLEGLLRETYTPQRAHESKPDIRSALESIRKRVASMGPALRSGYNEIARLRQALHERDIELHDGTCEALGAIVQRAAGSRKRPWFSVTSVEVLTGAIAEHYKQKIVDLVFWWLIVYGVITFDNVEQWSADGNWDYKTSEEYAVFTERGLVLLNELRTSGSTK